MEEERKMEDLAIKKETGKPKQITQEIPEKFLKSINESKDKKGQLLQQFVNISMQLVNLEEVQKTTVEKIKNVNQSISSQIKNAFNKLKLQKKREYRFIYDGKGSFIGNLIESKKIIEPKEIKK